MAKQNIARQQGDEYQELVFWKYALKMLNDEYEIEQITYEDEEVKSFDDIVVSYLNPQKFRDSTIIKEYIQVKFNMRNDKLFTIDSLISPEFINAKKKSLLDNLVQVYKKPNITFADSVFTIYSMRDIDQNDPLYSLVSNNDRTIDLDKLFDGTTDASAMGKIRKKFCDALNVNEDDLKCIMGQIKIKYRQETIDCLKESLNQQLEKQGLKIISDSKYSNPYSQLIKKLFQAGHRKFKKSFLVEQLNNEGLYHTKKNEKILIIRNYNKGVEHKSAEENNILKLERFFDGRFLKEEYKLTENIYPMIDNFLKERCIEDEKYFILLDANQTIAFMSGRILDIKTAKEIIPIQRTEKGLDSWEKKEVVNNQQAICKNESINNEENEVAVVISFSRDILNDVKAYLLEEKRKIGRIIDIRLAKINSSSVVDGTHAWELANQIKNIIDNRELSEKRSLLHIFMSCPNSVVFLLARYSLPFGKIQLYEYDFSGESTHTYYPTIMFPFDKKY